MTSSLLWLVIMDSVRVNAVALDLNLDYTKGERVNRCVIILLKSFPSVCTLSSLLYLWLRLHSRRPVACLHHSIPHFNWFIMLKYDSERGVSVYHVNQHSACVCVFVLKSADESVCYHALSF